MLTLRHPAVGRCIQYVSGNEAPPVRRGVVPVWIGRIDLPTARLHWWPIQQEGSCLGPTFVSLDSLESGGDLMCGCCGGCRALSSPSEMGEPEPMKRQLTLLTGVESLKPTEDINRCHPGHTMWKQYAVCSTDDQSIGRSVWTRNGQWKEDEVVVAAGMFA
jgi:hypothetical protein